MFGIICTADEPDPMTATRLPLSETVLSQLAEWSIWPLNDSRPEILGQTHLLQKEVRREGGQGQSDERARELDQLCRRAGTHLRTPVALTKRLAESSTISPDGSWNLKCQRLSSSPQAAPTSRWWSLTLRSSLLSAAVFLKYSRISGAPE